MLFRGFQLHFPGYRCSWTSFHVTIGYLYFLFWESLVHNHCPLSFWFILTNVKGSSPFDIYTRILDNNYYMCYKYLLECCLPCNLGYVIFCLLNLNSHLTLWVGLGTAAEWHSMTPVLPEVNLNKSSVPTASHHVITWCYSRPCCMVRLTRFFFYGFKHILFVKTFKTPKVMNVCSYFIIIF